MNVEIGAEAALFPEKEYINGIAVAVCREHTWQGTAGKCLKYIYYPVLRKTADVTVKMRI
jgi:hypothetical protein